MYRNNIIARFLAVFIGVGLVSHDCSGADYYDTHFGPLPLENDKAVLIVVSMENLNNASYCVQFFVAYISEKATTTTTTSQIAFDISKSRSDIPTASTNIFEDTGLTPERKITNVTLSRPHFLERKCTLFRFQNFPADLIILFPSEPFRQCDEYTNLCQVIIARHSKISTPNDISTDGSSFPDDCVILFSGRMQILSVSIIPNPEEILVGDIHPASQTCHDEAFVRLTQGLSSLLDYDSNHPVIARQHILVKRSVEDGGADRGTENNVIQTEDRTNKTPAALNNTVVSLISMSGNPQIVYRKGYLSFEAMKDLYNLLSLFLLFLFGVVAYKFFRVFEGAPIDDLVVESSFPGNFYMEDNGSQMWKVNTV